MTSRWLTLTVLLMCLIFPVCGGEREESTGAPAIESASSPAPPEKSAEERAIEDLEADFESRNFKAVVRGEKSFARDFPESPKLAQALYLSGRASIAAEDYDEGIATLRRMLENHPKDENIPFADLYIAEALYMKGRIPLIEDKIPLEEVLPRYEEALEAFRRVADKHAGHAEVATRAGLMIAQILSEMHRREEALAGFSDYVEKNPQGEYAYEALFQTAVLLSELERIDEAREAFTRLAKDYPGNPHSGTAIDRLAELNLIDNDMPPIKVSRWVNRPDGAPEYEGKVVLVAFWSTRCPPCEKEMPKLETLYQKLKDRGLVMLGLTADSRKQTEAQVKKSVTEAGLSFPIGMDELGRTADSYAVSRIPAVAIIDRKGIVRWRNSGELVTESLLERFL